MYFSWVARWLRVVLLRKVEIGCSLYNVCAKYLKIAEHEGAWDLGKGGQNLSRVAFPSTTAAKPNLSQDV